MRYRYESTAARVGLAQKMRIHRGPVLALSLALLVLAVVPSASAAATPKLLWNSPADLLGGSGAGQIALPEGVVANRVTGHIYVADFGNARVSEFDAWGQFIQAWGWGVRNGDDELQTCGPGALPPSSSCLPGIRGSEPGQFRGPSGGIAIDAAGNLFVADMENRRIQKFDPSGQFLLMFGGEVNKGPLHPGNLCTSTHIAEGDTCGAGTVGSGDGQFERIYPHGTYVTSGPEDLVYVADYKGRIQRFRPDGTFDSSVVLENQYNEKKISSIAIDDLGNLYVAPVDENNISKFDASGGLLSTIPASLPPGPTLAFDREHEELYVAVSLPSPPDGKKEVVAFDSNGVPTIPVGSGFSTADITNGVGGLVTNVVTSAGEVGIYVAVYGVVGDPEKYASAYGAAPDLWAPPSKPPLISAQYAVSVSSDAASVGADINPRFWADTSYSVEWGTGKCSEGGCPNRAPGSGGQQLGAGIVSSPVAARKIQLSDLEPGRTYSYRFVAESSGGGPVRGTGGTPDGDGAEGSFTTPGLVPTKTDSCPNAHFRSGASAALPDCRAYEMVSPVDKNNGDIVVTLINVQSNTAALIQSSVDGDRLTYSTAQGFGDAQGAPYVSQYLASRGAGAWSSANLTPSQGIGPLKIGHMLDIEFRAFTPDLCVAALRHDTDPPLAAGAVEGFSNIYRRANCDADGFQAVTTARPPSIAPTLYSPEVQGLSADGRCSVFNARDQLTPDAAPAPDPGGSVLQVYENCGEGLRLVSVLPTGLANTTGSAVGTVNGGNDSIRENTLTGSVSTDGSRIYWTAAQSGKGPLYLRINAAAEQSPVSGGKCIDASKACTVRVSQTVSGSAAHFWSGSPDGARALFTIEDGSLAGNLYEFKLGAKNPSTLIASQVTGFLGASTDADRAYFVSSGVLSGAGALGKSPIAGAPNLYLHDADKSGADRIRFIATLSPEDVKIEQGQRLSPISLAPYKKTSRVTPDGGHAIFMSDAALTGYDNTDSENGRQDAEVFAYDAGAEGAAELVCVSCNPTGQRPVGRNVPIEGQPSLTWAAALLPPYGTSFYGSRAISDDGSHAFFQSFEPLVPRDTNGKADVYQWSPPGAGDCSEQSVSFSVINQGCLSLISSGQSPTDSLFLDASADGADVFFTTSSSLLAEDPGLIDIYDARAGGGYPPPPSRPAACEGESCQGPLSPPNDPTPASLVFEGAGNARDGKTRPRCAKGKTKRKGRCVAKRKAKNSKHRAKSDRRASR